MHINCLTVLLWLRTVSTSGVFTHTEVAHRALLNYDSDQFGAGTVRSILLRRQAAFQAGAAFPDSFYNPLCGEQGVNSIEKLKMQLSCRFNCAIELKFPSTKISIVL